MSSIDFSTSSRVDIIAFLKLHSLTKDSSIFIEKIATICANNQFNRDLFREIIGLKLLRKGIDEEIFKIGDLWTSVIDNYAIALRKYSDNLNIRNELQSKTGKV